MTWAELPLRQGGLAIVEADESDRSFLNLHPTHAVVTHRGGPSGPPGPNEIPLLPSIPRHSAGWRLTSSAPRPNVRHLPNINAPHLRHRCEADYIATDVEVSQGTRYSARGPGRYWRGVDPSRADTMPRTASQPSRWPGVGHRSAGCGVRRRYQARGVSTPWAFRGACVVELCAPPHGGRSTIDGARRIAPHRVVAVFQPHLFSCNSHGRVRQCVPWR